MYTNRHIPPAGEHTRPGCGARRPAGLPPPATNFPPGTYHCVNRLAPSQPIALTTLSLDPLPNVTPHQLKPAPDRSLIDRFYPKSPYLSQESTFDRFLKTIQRIRLGWPLFARNILRPHLLLRDLNLPNALISRVCTLFHINQNFFLQTPNTTCAQHPSSALGIWLFRHSLSPSVLSVPFLCALCVTLFLSSTSAQDTTPFPSPSSKKGLQVQMVDDALALGIKHAALNVNFAQLLDLSEPGKLKPHQSYLEHLDRQIKPLSDSGAVVSLILLYYRSGNEALDKLMLHPKYDPAAPNKLTAFNLTTPASAAAFSACIDFLAARYSPADSKYGRVWNYIVGNEVNSHWFWYNMGRASMEELANDYLIAVRACHASVRKHSMNARVYLSLEHHWNIRYPGGGAQQAFAGRPFIEYFAQQARASGDFDWHIAFHPYPEDLFDCRTWNDKSATHQTDTPRITFKNIQQLTDFVRRPEIRYRGEPRRIILSEQGFHSSESAEGQWLQAAAYAYAYQQIRKLDGIDSFILHRHVDHGDEGGLNLGLWSRNKDAKNPSEPFAKKSIYEVFKAADTDRWEAAFQFALTRIGIKSWAELGHANRD